MIEEKKKDGSSKLFAPLLVVIAASLWAVDGIVLRPSLYSLPVPLVVFVESAIVAILLTPFFIKRFSSLKQLKKKIGWHFLVLLCLVEP
ncbi:MAG: hypothetical protein MZV64_57080 [Ignavibacteriales bacterium]|nr:hypothetical protein [Ignavibacteriales bacterium]